MDKSIKITEEYKIKSCEVSATNYLKPMILLHFLEDAAYSHAEKYGFGYSSAYPKGYGWFMLKCHIKLLSLPRAWDKISVTTWATEGRGIQCRRDFLVHNSAKEVIAKVATNWGLVNFETKRLVNPFKTLDFIELFPEYAFETDFEKIEPVEKAVYSKEMDVMFDDIDLNQHVNNSVYIHWATEAMPFEFLKTHNLTEIEIYFKREATLGIKILSEADFDEAKNVSIHSIKNRATGEELTALRLHWEKTT